jgi:hypothetical protein
LFLAGFWIPFVAHMQRKKSLMSLHFHFDEVCVTHANGAPISTSPCCDCCGQAAVVRVVQLTADGKVVTTALCLHHAIAAGLLGPDAQGLLGVNACRHEAHDQARTMAERLLRATGNVPAGSLGDLLASAIPFATPPTEETSEEQDMACEIAGLKAELAMAIEDENYESAARWRNKLSALQKHR